MEKIKLNIDNQQLKEKPATFSGALRNRLCNRQSIREILAETLVECIERGQSFTPAVMTGTRADSWQSQQVICADIDNDTGNKAPLPQPLTPAQARDIMSRHGIDPFAMYYSFSNKEGWPKFRIVLVLDEPITDPAKAKDFSQRFTGIFNAEIPHCADPTNKDLARLYYGGRPGSVFYRGGITLTETLEALPEYLEPTKTHESGALEWDDVINDPLPAPNPAGYVRRYSDLQAQFERDKESFDLGRYVEMTTGSRPKQIGNALFYNPCPLCGHNDDFQVTGSIYHCFGANGGTGGTIIDYLQHREGIDLATAIDRFKFDIMRYDRDEWRKAYIQEEFSDDENSPADDFPGEMEKPAEIENESPEEEAGADDLELFFQKIQTEAYKPYKTGITFFDNLLGGGVIQQSILLLLAAPGTGKTTLAQQLAENMAKNKKPVLYLNFEMSREQMLAKAISAKLFREGESAKTALGILQGYRWSDEEREEIERTIDEYRRESYPYIRYNPAGISSELNGLLEKLTALGEKAKAAGMDGPAVVVDYLHLVTSRDRLDTQELIKQTVLGLKEYAVKYNTFVIGIVATNRSSNSKGKITMESGRDSSNLEYTADYQISLNYHAVDQGIIKPEETDKIADLQKQPRKKMILRVLKNRHGQPGGSAVVMFDSAHNTFFGTVQDFEELEWDSEIDVDYEEPAKDIDPKVKNLIAAISYLKEEQNEEPTVENIAKFFEVKESTIRTWLLKPGGRAIKLEDGMLAIKSDERSKQKMFESAPTI